jgi:hypothetical protein
LGQFASQHLGAVRLLLLSTSVLAFSPAAKKGDKRKKKKKEQHM